MYLELTKAQKKVARELIDLGLERECQQFVDNIQNVVTKPLGKERPYHARYIEIYKMTERFDKHIAQRYDGLGGSRYFMTVARLYCDGFLSNEEIALLGEELVNKILFVKQ